MAIAKGKTNKKQIKSFWNSHSGTFPVCDIECQHMTFFFNVRELNHTMYGTEEVFWQRGHLMHDLTHLYALLCSIINDLDMFEHRLGPDVAVWYDYPTSSHLFSGKNYLSVPNMHLSMMDRHVQSML